MPQRVNVSLLPELSSASQFAGSITVVIDVLRASTTITTALAQGAIEVLPCLEVEEARNIAASRPDVVLGGERQGIRIDGFDLGNSPAEYTSDRVSGRTVVFTTTNGTRALQHCRQAKRILLGAFVNLSALCDQLRGSASVELLCAGTNGRVTREDVLFAGAVVEQLSDASPGPDVNDQAQIAVAAWKQARSRFAEGTPLAACLTDSLGGRNLIEIGQQRDIEIAATVDQFEVVPELDPKDSVIRLP
jgi:2-phosphosulfolactate phosphatase